MTSLVNLFHNKYTCLCFGWFVPLSVSTVTQQIVGKF